MADDFEEQCLKTHNEYRRKHGAQPLVLDREICNTAQRWANYIASRNVMQHSSGTGYGENIYAASGQKVNGKMPVDSWYDEVRQYRYGSGFSMATGHFTQVVWKGSQKLGVGRATNGSGWTYVVANYYPPGNYANQFSANVLPPGNYFKEEPKKEVPKKEEPKREEPKKEQPKNEQAQSVAQPSKPKQASRDEISDDIHEQIKSHDLGKAQGFCDYIYEYLSERYDGYDWIATLTDGSPNATYCTGNILDSFNFVIKCGSGKTIVNVFQLSRQSEEDGDDVSLDMEELAIAAQGEDSSSEASDSSDRPSPPASPQPVAKPAPKPQEEFDEFSRECLDAHNEYRRKHGCPPLKLAKWLCNVAQNWAERCASMDAMQHSWDHPNDNENIFCSYGPRSSVKGRQPVDCFYSEIKYYQFGRMEFSMQTGHFTAMIWKSCKELGVGVATSRSGKTYVVNSYSPKANMMGAFAANVPPPQY